MSEFENMFEEDTANIESDIMDIKQSARMKGIIAKLQMYSENPQELTAIYTDILLDDNVSYLLTRISQDMVFYRQFPEFYASNEYGENVINCQQNSSYHKYSVFRHILATIEYVGNPQIPIGDWQKKLLKWTMLLHDIGKPYVKIISEDGTESFAGHEDKSAELATGILNRFYFTDEEKKIILSLIKYHDKFLNEGEITYNNMKFLASELNNNKELFYLLIDVKDSDARAKSLDVYNKYKITKNKYIEFINSYFIYNEERELSIEVKNKEEEEINNLSVFENQEMSILEINNLLEDVLNRKKVRALYQPVIDIRNKIVYGYEIFTKIESDKRVDIVELLNHAKDIGKYDKIQQVMLVNGIDIFENIQSKEANILFVNSDLVSYEKYVNKPRLYDMMAKNKIVIEFHNYEKKDLSDMQNVIETIHKNKGYVALDNFGVGTLTTDDINLLDVDYIIPDMSLIKDIVNDEEKQKYMTDLVTYAISKGINIVVIGVENKEALDVIRKIGVRFAQGYYFARPDMAINMLNGKLKTLLDDSAEESIS